ANGIISTVSVAPVFLNYFNNTTVESNVTDFQIKIWADDGTGSPGQELYSRDESVTSSRISGLSYNFIEFDIPSDEPALAELPDRIYIGIANAGVDDNILVLSPAVHVQGEPSSYLNDVSAGGWIPLAEFDHDKFDKPMEGQAFPIRARFLVPTASEVASELPTEVALAQNYPNPFNPSTTIAYALPRPMHVRLSVYNALGQRVATVVDGMQQAGAHETRVDATGWASGVYLYALESEHRTLTQRMVVLK
ncbi:MAG: T9SS type A sorting domain-containing protein, partial [Rhodothermales bacterium]